MLSSALPTSGESTLGGTRVPCCTLAARHYPAWMSPPPRERIRNHSARRRHIFYLFRFLRNMKIMKSSFRIEPKSERRSRCCVTRGARRTRRGAAPPAPRCLPLPTPLHPAPPHLTPRRPGIALQTACRRPKKGRAGNNAMTVCPPGPAMAKPGPSPRLGATPVRPLPRAAITVAFTSSAI